MDAKARVQSFHWSDCVERMGSIPGNQVLELQPGANCFAGRGVRVWPPAVFPVPERLALAVGDPQSARESAARRSAKPRLPNADLTEYLGSLPAEPGLHCLILLQAGAATLGMFEGGETLATKTLKRYVVRGRGRAQPAYLASKGKSRYGSRLRLQNARLLFEETCTKLTDYWEQFGAPELIFASAPRRVWPDLFRAKNQPPFGPQHPIVRVPWDLPVPTTETLLRTYKRLCHGRIEWSSPAAD